MLLPKKDRLKVYSELFKEGVLVAEKNFSKPEHETITEVRNLHVLKLMQSLKSRGFVRETFSWQWSYYYLTEEGIEYLRDYLHLPEEIVPNTHKVQERPMPSGGRPGGRGFNNEYQGGRGFGRGGGF
eukprot:snap_masked-scaffold_8-processed-gene-2.44-mRNA-1 protein AED:0.14 eAED:0.14 QI:0/-1/0/1/-1/1/1/0/126